MRHTAVISAIRRLRGRGEEAQSVCATLPPPHCRHLSTPGGESALVALLRPRIARAGAERGGTILVRELVDEAIRRQTNRVYALEVGMLDGRNDVRRACA